MATAAGIFLVFCMGVAVGHIHGRSWERREQRGRTKQGLPFSDHLNGKGFD